MDIIFTNERQGKEFNDTKQLVRVHGPVRAKKIRLRLTHLQAADMLEDMKSLPGRCHELKGNRTDQLALDLDGPYRLILEPAHDPIPRRSDGGLDWTLVTAVKILEVVDYHD